MNPELENISATAVPSEPLVLNAREIAVVQMMRANTSDKDSRIRQLEDENNQLKKDIQTQELAHKQEVMIKDLQIQVLTNLLIHNGIPMPNLTAPPTYTPPSTASTRHTFDSIIQSGVDKESLKKEMHTLIDGKGGVQVARVLAKAYDDALIHKLPDEDEYSSEFTLNGTWRAISKHFKDGKPKDDYKFVQDYSSIRFTTVIQSAS